jgi:hypothetical protein
MRDLNQAQQRNFYSLLLLSLVLLTAYTTPGKSQKDSLIKKLIETKGLVALWDFKENERQKRMAYGVGKFPLKEVNGAISRVKEGPLSGYSAKLGNKAFLSLPNEKTGALNIYGKKQGITVIAWIKWYGNTGFIGGMWNEYQGGGKRQYGLFVSLPYYNGENQVCGHISLTGKPTPPFPYSIDYAASKLAVKKGAWQCVAFTYDGQWIKSYLNGEFDSREPELINHTIGFDGYPKGLIQSKNPYYFPDGIGNNGSDFTVGAVLLESGAGHFFNGLIGGLAIFDRALSPDEINHLYSYY